MKNLFDLTGKKALVVGHEGNLGPLWVEVLEAYGAVVTSFGLPFYDITKQRDINQFCEQAIKTGFAPDIVVYNAAIDNPPGSDATFFGNFREIMDVNIFGAVNLYKKLIPLMKKKGGVIVNIGSIQGYGGADWQNYEGNFEKPFGYNASKWCLRGLAKSITTLYGGPGRGNIRSVTPSFGPYDGGKLSKTFLDKFLKRVPLKRTISKESLQQTLIYACCCQDLAGVDWRVDAGLGAWA